MLFLAHTCKLVSVRALRSSNEKRKQRFPLTTSSYIWTSLQAVSDATRKTLTTGMHEFFIFNTLVV